MKSGADPSSTPPGKQATPVRVVTFDLDNTLWKTGAVIGAANDALYEFMAETELNVPTRVELVMGELHKTNPGAYNPSLNEKKNDDNLREYEDGTAGQTTASTGAPVLLTQLRKDAVAQVCMEHNNFTPEEAEEYSQRAFDVWTNARHAAIPHHLAQDVVSSLQRLRDMKSSEGHPIVIGAITDGNSDPRNVPELKPIFDFCVNSENVGVSKPNAKVYLKAMELVLGGSYPVITESISNVASLDDGAGSWWVHVGDDFMKDIVAAKELRMRSIWATELIRDKLPEKNPVEKKPQENRDVGDFIKILASKPVVEMTIGTKDFLIEAVEEEFVDARAETFVDIVDTIVEWNKESSYVIDIDVSTVRADVQAETATEEVMVSLPSERENSQTKKSGVLKNKFCVFCGEKNPSVAKFCLACGEKQPDFP
jgi:FMN phosphatase YigB (HAD superfamily)